uniref:RRM domain-containing protein n=1 Tax=Ditylenchus dipsaci TaxID=166011 RepID=A0A915DJP0_9BILA
MDENSHFIPNGVIFVAMAIGNSNTNGRSSSPAASTSSSSGMDSAIGASIGASPATSSTSSSTPPLPLNLQSGSGECCSSLRLAYCVVDGRSPANVNYVEIGHREVLHQLHNLAQRINQSIHQGQRQDTTIQPSALLVASNEDVRQSIYPFVANSNSSNSVHGSDTEPHTTKQTDNTSTQEEDMVDRGTTEMPSLFHRFLAVDDVAAIVLSKQFVNESPETSVPQKCSLEQRIQALVQLVQTEGVNLLSSRRLETVNQEYISTVCCDQFVDSSLVVRARGLPWQASEKDIALFFLGLNIAPGGIALCLSAEGRRNGEALVRFETPRHRDLALQRHRKFLHSRYIEVYRGTGEDFMKVAVGSDSEAVKFASKDAAMIVRMRGLPFQTTEQQIRDFFAEPNEDTGIVEQGGILFVNRQDGRPSGDAFVLFTNEAAGRRALAKHKNRIGTRYIELFRTTQAEVQQLFNRTLKSPPTFQPTLTAPKRDCIRLRGLPYEAQVQQVVDFLGGHSRNIVFQGVHMIYNNQGHPSGEAFIQLDSENSAVSAAQSMHNKYMELGKRRVQSRGYEFIAVHTSDVSRLAFSNHSELFSKCQYDSSWTHAQHHPNSNEWGASHSFPTSQPILLVQPIDPSPTCASTCPPPTSNASALNLAAAAAAMAGNGNFCFPAGFSNPPPLLGNGCEQQFYSTPQFPQIPFYPDAAAAASLMQQHAQQQINGINAGDAATAGFIFQQNMLGRFAHYVPPLHPAAPQATPHAMDLSIQSTTQQQAAQQFALIHT